MLCKTLNNMNTKKMRKTSQNRQRQVKEKEKEMQEIRDEPSEPSLAAELQSPVVARPLVCVFCRVSLHSSVYSLCFPAVSVLTLSVPHSLSLFTCVSILEATSLWSCIRMLPKYPPPSNRSPTGSTYPIIHWASVRNVSLGEAMAAKKQKNWNKQLDKTFQLF